MGAVVEEQFMVSFDYVSGDDPDGDGGGVSVSAVRVWEGGSRFKCTIEGVCFLLFNS